MAVGDHDNDPPSDTPEAATVVSLKSARSRARLSKRSPSETGSSHTASTTGSRTAQTSGTPISATQRADLLVGVLLGDELTRAHGFAGGIAMISGGVLAVLPFLDGHPLAKLACGVALLWICLASIWAFRRTYPDAVYDRTTQRLHGVTITTGVIAVAYYCGLFSPVTLVVTLGVYFLGQSSDPFQALGLPIYVSVFWVVLAVLITLGLVPDVGLFDAVDASVSSHVFAIIAVATVLAITVAMARVSRTSMRDAIERSNEAMLTAQKREALLIEAQQQLERALHNAVGKPGLHTGKIAGSYRLGSVIGVGAMGEVYEATHERDGTPAAVKFMQANVQQHEDLVQRFLREAMICQRLDHPNIVRVLESGTLTDGTSYMAMELLRGTDLASHLRKDGPMPLSDMVTLARELAAALTHAHEAGIVHRDLKPVNVFLDEDPQTKTRRWKVLDFGISKLIDSSGTLTNVGIVGTPGYMSPEQAQGHAVDPRSDVFSMCVVLYRALTGRPAFSGNDTPQIMFEVVYKSPLRPSSVVDSLPFEVDAVFALGLAKNPDERWASAADVIAALELAVQGKSRSEWKARARKLLKTQPWGQTVRTG